MSTSYIYKISFDNINQTYIGHSLNPEQRFKRHLQQLRDGIHHSKKLQQAYDLYQTIPNLDILEECEDKKALLQEKYWIEQYNSYYDGYNGTPGGESLGIGEDCPASRYCLDDYKAVLCFLAYTDMRTSEIAKELEVGQGVVLNISSQTNHLYLKDLMPIEWNMMQQKKRHHPNWRTYPNVKSPEGQIYQVFSARKFSREHNLDQADFGKLLNGKKRQCKGWTLQKDSINA